MAHVVRGGTFERSGVSSWWAALRSGVARLLPGVLLLAGAAGSMASGAAPAGSPAEGDERSSAALTALLERAAAQEARIAELQQQAAASRVQDIDEQRIAAMRAQVREILSESEFRAGLADSTLQTGYEKGFFIRSGDDSFLLNFRGMVQFRYIYYNTHSQNRYLSPGTERDDRSGVDLSRVRLVLSGHVHSPDLTYYLQLRSDAGGRYDTALLDAYVNYRFVDAFQVRLGIFKSASTQAGITSSAEFQFVDRPVFDAIYGFDRGLGLRLWGTLAEQRFEWHVTAFNSLRNVRGRTITPDPSELDTNPGIVARLAWNALNPKADLNSEGDLAFLEEPALNFAIHYAFNEDDGDPRGSRIPAPLVLRARETGAFGLVSTRGLQINQFGLSSNFKFRGFSARGEYVVRVLDVRDRAAAPWFAVTGDDSTTAQHGAYLQAGWFLPIPAFERKVELVGRVGAVAAHANDVECAFEYAAGLNYYIKGHKVKLQTDVTRVTEAPISSANNGVATVNDEAWYWRMQLQLAF